jgi:hypothetical protein
MAGSVTKGRLPKAYRTCPAARESSLAWVQIKLRAHPTGHLLEGVVGLRRYAGQEVEDVLRARITSTMTSTPAFRAMWGQPPAVVEQRLVAADLNVDRRQAFQVGMDRASQFGASAGGSLA